MKLYNGLSPNGARVAIFLQEKGIAIPTTSLDILAGEAKADDFVRRNSLGQVPLLELDDGRYLSESIAICRYLESLHPTPSLFGATPIEQAFIEMWIRRIELGLFIVAGDVGLHEIEYFKSQVEQNADYAQARRRTVAQRLIWLDKELSDGRAFVAGEAFSMADIVGMTFLFITGFMQIDIPQDLKHVTKWADALMARPSFPKMPEAA